MDCSAMSTIREAPYTVLKIENSGFLKLLIQSEACDSSENKTNNGDSFST
jgi:hypothetical protein